MVFVKLALSMKNELEVKGINANIEIIHVIKNF